MKIVMDWADLEQAIDEWLEKYHPKFVPGDGSDWEVMDNGEEVNGEVTVAIPGEVTVEPTPAQL